MSKLKLTGFGRFAIFLLIAIPVVYFGMQYLQNSGTLDKIKEKVESPAVAEEEVRQPQSGKDILNEIDNKPSKEQEELIAEQQRKIDELERQNREMRENEANRPAINDILPPTPRSTPTNERGARGLDGLIATAEDNMRQKGNNPNIGSDAPSTTSTGDTKSLAIWTFSFSGTNGTIELFQKGQQLIARTSYAGRSKVDVQELIEKNDRLYVQGSPAKEYYTLRSNGDLDAYDNSGFLTTCSMQ